MMLRPLVSKRFQDLFHSLIQGTFHLSLTVLVHYRSLDVFSLTGWFRQIHTEFHMFRATQDTHHRHSTCIRDYHPLWSTFPSGSADILTGSRRSYNPNNAETMLVWAVPRSLAATKGIINYFLFLRVLRCFSSPGLRWAAEARLPHSEIYASKVICTSA